MAGAIISTGRKDYCTPNYILAKVRDFFNQLNGRGITLDPCSNPKSRVMASKNIMLESGMELASASANAHAALLAEKLETHLFNGLVAAEQMKFPKMEFVTGDGLATSWQGENTYFNPPFGYDKVTKIGIKNWIQKALDEAEQAKQTTRIDIPNAEIIACIPDTPETGPWKNGILLKAQGRCQLGKRVTFVGMNAVIPKPIALVYFGSNPQLFKEVFKTIGRVENPSEVYADQADIRL